jgi:hypothetical protein
VPRIRLRIPFIAPDQQIKQEQGWTKTDLQRNRLGIQVQKLLTSLPKLTLVGGAGGFIPKASETVSMQCKVSSYINTDFWAQN